MGQGMLQECCHLPCHRQFQIACYIDSGLSSPPLLHYVESWSVDSGASALVLRSKPGTY